MTATESSIIAAVIRWHRTRPKERDRWTVVGQQIHLDPAWGGHATAAFAAERADLVLAHLDGRIRIIEVKSSPEDAKRGLRREQTKLAHALFCEVAWALPRHIILMEHEILWPAWAGVFAIDTVKAKAYKKRDVPLRSGLRMMPPPELYGHLLCRDQGNQRFPRS